MINANELICPICGDPTSIYMGNARKDKLCRKHAKELKSNLIELCPDCNQWHNTNIPCKCKNQITELPTKGFEKCILCGVESNGYAFCKDCYYKFSNEELLEILNNNSKQIDIIKKSTENNNELVFESYSKENSHQKENNDEIEEKQININNKLNSVIIIDKNTKSRCITCGKQTDGLLFCGQCYNKYKNKELLFKITNATNIELLDENYEGRYSCKDGHIVKSKSEREIDNYLFEHGISHAYEKALQYGANEKEVLYPDFYLPNYLGQGKNVYIEHWGYNENNIHYTKTKKFKIPIYEKLKTTLICTYEKADMKDIDGTLDRKLNKLFIKEDNINFSNE